MAEASFTDNLTLKVIALDGETFTLKALLPVSKDRQPGIAEEVAFYFDKHFSDDKTSMVYWVLMSMWGRFTFSNAGSDRREERERIGGRIRELRESKGIAAKQLAALADINAANLSRIEHGSYSVGLDILTRIAHALGAKVDIV